MDQPKKPTDYSNLGKAIHWFAISLGLLVYGVVVKLLVPPWATNLVALLMNLSAGFILAGLIFLLLRFFGFDLEERVQGELDEAVSRLNETSTLLNKSIGNISRLQSLEDSDLIRYCNRITDTSPDKWYQHLRRSNGPIWLMGPSLKAWFKENEKLMTEILLQK
ncbi:MAG TPA: hypothetical protein VK274_02070, partial [Pyrinomonadaceae bacterium]|nr:hypothetical protein [Pyrinomonadaceae bacterium]